MLDRIIAGPRAVRDGRSRMDSDAPRGEKVSQHRAGGPSADDDRVAGARRVHGVALLKLSWKVGEPTPTR